MTEQNDFSTDYSKFTKKVESIGNSAERIVKYSSTLIASLGELHTQVGEKVQLPSEKFSYREGITRFCDGLNALDSCVQEKQSGPKGIPRTLYDLFTVCGYSRGNAAAKDFEPGTFEEDGVLSDLEDLLTLVVADGFSVATNKDGSPSGHILDMGVEFNTDNADYCDGVKAAFQELRNTMIDLNHGEYLLAEGQSKLRQRILEFNNDQESRNKPIESTYVSLASLHNDASAYFQHVVAQMKQRLEGIAQPWETICTFVTDLYDKSQFVDSTGSGFNLPLLGQYQKPVQNP